MLKLLDEQHKYAYRAWLYFATHNRHIREQRPFRYYLYMFDKRVRNINMLEIKDGN